MTKDFKIREGVKLQIRTEAFNAFNHASLAQPNNDLTDKNVGKITGIWPQSEMRRLQFAARVDF